MPRLTESPPIALEARFKNEGTVHEAPTGEIEVRDTLGWLVATATLPVRNVLPGVERKVAASVRLTHLYLSIESRSGCLFFTHDFHNFFLICSLFPQVPPLHS